MPTAFRDLDPQAAERLRRQLAEGGRLVYYEYCISLIFFTLRRPSGVYHLPAGRYGWRPALGFSLVSLLLGWWGLPWGIIYTPLTLLSNLGGGRDVTAEAWAGLERTS